MKQSVVVVACMLLGVALCAPAGVSEATDAAQDIKVSDNLDDLDVNDVTAVIEEIFPIIRKSISLFSGAAGSSRTLFPVGTTSVEGGGVDSPFVPNYVIPGYTIPGNRFTPDINIPSIRIQK
ncbi:uncharacterized protein LOC126987228 isoform X2 [Eriocheir sinensis]|uniref:uncharacterized protein LOC126987228 isoform X2 n=1 Tax=Eriocheir sinensis TaxID=95602 RepID=UPI0021C98AE2|nr:uncharacterized protein LOC126987228 isoform X2 [Eriocheir sinensis]